MLQVKSLKRPRPFHKIYKTDIPGTLLQFDNFSGKEYNVITNTYKITSIYQAITCINIIL